MAVVVAVVVVVVAVILKLTCRERGGPLVAFCLMARRFSLRVGRESKTLSERVGRRNGKGCRECDISCVDQLIS